MFLIINNISALKYRLFGFEDILDEDWGDTKNNQLPEKENI